MRTPPAVLHQAHFGTRVLSLKQQAAATRLLSVFAQHLALAGNHLLVQRKVAEPAVIGQARAFIHEHQAEGLSLGQVARAARVSRFHLCKLFRQVTGLAFTDYVSRLRIERAKTLLLDPNQRVGTVAAEVGFGSVTHFNRVFRRVLGYCASEYRRRMREVESAARPRAGLRRAGDS